MRQLYSNGRGEVSASRPILFDVRTCTRLTIATLLAASILAPHVLAQNSTFTVQVIDKASAYLPGVTVTITPVSDCAESGTPTGSATIGTTLGQGIAAFVAVAQQTDRVETTLTGFTTDNHVYALRAGRSARYHADCPAHADV